MPKTVHTLDASSPRSMVACQWLLWRFVEDDLDYIVLRPHLLHLSIELPDGFSETFTEFAHDGGRCRWSMPAVVCNNLRRLAGCATPPPSRGAMRIQVGDLVSVRVDAETETGFKAGSGPVMTLRAGEREELLVNAQPQLWERVRRFSAQWLDRPVNEITPCALVREDLEQFDEAGDGFIEAFANEFRVDLAQYDPERHFLTHNPVPVSLRGLLWAADIQRWPTLDRPPTVTVHSD